MSSAPHRPLLPSPACLRSRPPAQNNGKIAHQVVPHVHFHVIPKPGAEGAPQAELDKAGLVVGWPAHEADKDELKKLQAEVVARLEAQ
jgi:diadenosine tetraphosphate (Ap4A) HIT family hydrolase